jgi:hypothetical protein
MLWPEHVAQMKTTAFYAVMFDALIQYPNRIQYLICRGSFCGLALASFTTEKSHVKITGSFTESIHSSCWRQLRGKKVQFSEV